MLNNVVLMGRMVRPPELKSTTAGVSVLSFSLAVERNFVTKGEPRGCDFITCVAWRQTAEFISRYFGKGQLMAVSGELQTRNYEDKDGKKRVAVEVVVAHAYFAEPKRQGGDAGGFDVAGGAVCGAAGDDAFAALADDEDLPF